MQSFILKWMIHHCLTHMSTRQAINTLASLPTAANYIVRWHQQCILSKWLFFLYKAFIDQNVTVFLCWGCFNKNSTVCVVCKHQACNSHSSGGWEKRWRYWQVPHLMRTSLWFIASSRCGLSGQGSSQSLAIRGLIPFIVPHPHDRSLRY